MSDGNKEEILRSFNAHLRYILQEHKATKSCTFFLTNNRIIVASIEGINLWTAATVIIALAASFTGLLLRNFDLFAGGLVIGTLAAIIIGLIDFAIRFKRKRIMKKLNPDLIMQMNKENLEIRYSTISKVEFRTSQTPSRGSWFLPLSLPENKYVLDFFTDSNKHTVVIEPEDLEPCLSIIRRFVPKIIEIEED